MVLSPEKFRIYRKQLQSIQEDGIVENYIKARKEKGLTIRQIQNLLSRGHCFSEIFQGKWNGRHFVVPDMFDLSNQAKIEEEERLNYR